MKSRALLSLLADGQVHSGESLATSLGVSRTAIWKQVRRAAHEGYAIDTIRGKGYRLVAPPDLLEADAILREIPPPLDSAISLEVYDELDSTNAEVIRQKARDRGGRTLVCIADHQTAGRGRRGRHWKSPRGQNLYLSFGLTFRGGFAMLDGLSLVLGLAVAEALETRGVIGVGLKWPNDVFLEDSKLSGILVELQGELEEGVVQVVAGIGLNVHMSDAENLDQAWTSLARSLPERRWQRNEIAAAIIKSVLSEVQVFQNEGFRAFRRRWEALDVFRGCEIAARDGSLAGIGCGIDDQGNYLVDANGRMEKVRAGEISLRARS